MAQTDYEAKAREIFSIFTKRWYADGFTTRDGVELIAAALREVAEQKYAEGRKAGMEKAVVLAESKAADRCLRHEKSGKGACGYQIASAIRLAIEKLNP